MGIWKSNATRAIQTRNKAKYHNKTQRRRQIPKGQMEKHYARILTTKRENRVEKKEA
jgi:hypothetical protein